jgi:hypothetical protein
MAPGRCKRITTTQIYAKTGLSNMGENGVKALGR